MPEGPVPSAPMPGPPRPVAAPPTTPETLAAVPAAPRAEDGTTPQTGDLVVDAVLDDLAGVDAADLDAVLAAGDAVHTTLTSRLSDLGS